MNQLSERYATALFDLALETNNVDNWKKQVLSIKPTFGNDIVKFFSSFQVSKEDKKTVLLETFKGKVDEYLINFMCLIVDKRRFNEINNILDGFVSLCNDYFQIKEGVVYSAKPLKKEEIIQIQESLIKNTNKKFELKNLIDESLISGFKIVIDNKVIDYSMKNRIDLMKKEIIEKMR